VRDSAAPDPVADYRVMTKDPFFKTASRTFPMILRSKGKTSLNKYQN
jgi:hypothetical protein